MINIIKMALYENNELSLTRLIAVASWLLFAVVSIYLVAFNITWADYATFASITGGGGAATQIANKLMNSKYNTATGSFEPKKPAETKGC